MKRVFADTSFYVALFNPDDEHHEAARKWSERDDVYAVVTGFVMLEFGGLVAGRPSRRLVEGLIRSFRKSRHTLFLPVSEDRFDAGLRLYSRRPDKEWSLTDCTSFVVMDQEGLKETLTTDHHFQQAGFKALLL